MPLLTPPRQRPFRARIISIGIYALLLIIVLCSFLCSTQLSKGEQRLVWLLGASLLVLLLGTFNRTSRAVLDAWAKLAWSTTKIVVLFFAFLLVSILVYRLSVKPKGISILPFNNETGDTIYSGDAVAESLKIELLRIQGIHSRYYDGIACENMKAKEFEGSSEKLADSVKDIGTLGVGEARLSIGGIFLAARTFWPFQQPGILISGSIQKFGRDLHLVAFVQQEGKLQGFALALKAEENGAVPSMIRDMAYIIGKTALGQKLSARTLEAFQNFTEALDCYGHYQVGRDIKALEQGQTFCISAERAEPKYSKLFPLLKHLGIAFYLEGAYKESGESFEQATGIDPSDAETWNFLGIARAALGETGSAQFALEKARELSKNSISAQSLFWVNLGYAYYRVHDYNTAAKGYAEALAVNGNDPQALVGSGDCAYMLGDASTAGERYRKAAEQSHYLTAYLRLGSFAFEDGRFKEALSYFKQALSVDAESAETYCCLGDLYLDRRDFVSADRYYKQALQIAPKNYAARVGLGEWARIKGDFEKAQAALSSAIEVAPFKASPHVSLGDLYFSKGDYDAALKEYERGIQLSPRESDALLGVANVLRKKGRYRDAEDRYNQIIKMWPKDTDGYCCLGALFLEEQKDDDATVEFQKSGGMLAGKTGWLCRTGRRFARQTQIL
jgi:tetratricopeptide (TPR) repeat protein